VRRRRRADIDRAVEALLAGERLPEGELDPRDAAALEAAIELRAARPGADSPSEEFVTDLRRRVAQAHAELEAETTRTTSSAPAEPRIGRRALLAAAGGSVAAGVVGAVAESRFRGQASGTNTATGPIVPDNAEWVPVTTDAALPDGEVQRFATATAVGFVVNRGGTVSAVSGACTHQGCLLALNQPLGRLDCPCHRTSFALDGSLLLYQLQRAPAPLPTISVRRRNGTIEALLPKEV
jgi:cytochrome b6-f complex iron-sulfur subunit